MGRRPRAAAPAAAAAACPRGAVSLCAAHPGAALHGAWQSLGLYGVGRPCASSLGLGTSQADHSTPESKCSTLVVVVHVGRRVCVAVEAGRSPCVTCWAHRAHSAAWPARPHVSRALPLTHTHTHTHTQTHTLSTHSTHIHTHLAHTDCRSPNAHGTPAQGCYPHLPSHW